MYLSALYRNLYQNVLRLIEGIVVYTVILHTLSY